MQNHSAKKAAAAPQKRGSILRTQHLKHMKIAKAETIAAFIKNTEAFFENHTRDRASQQSVSQLDGQTKMPDDKDSLELSPSPSPNTRSLERNQRVKQLQVQGLQANAELSLAVENGDIQLFETPTLLFTPPAEAAELQNPRFADSMNYPNKDSSRSPAGTTSSLGVLAQIANLNQKTIEQIKRCTELRRQHKIVSNNVETAFTFGQRLNRASLQDLEYQRRFDQVKLMTTQLNDHRQIFQASERKRSQGSPQLHGKKHKDRNTGCSTSKNNSPALTFKNRTLSPKRPQPVRTKMSNFEMQNSIDQSSATPLMMLRDTQLVEYENLGSGNASCKMSNITLPNQQFWKDHQVSSKLKHQTLQTEVGIQRVNLHTEPHFRRSSLSKAALNRKYMISRHKQLKLKQQEQHREMLASSLRRVNPESSPQKQSLTKGLAKNHTMKVGASLPDFHGNQVIQVHSVKKEIQAKQKLAQFNSLEPQFMRANSDEALNRSQTKLAQQEVYSVPTFLQQNTVQNQTSSFESINTAFQVNPKSQAQLGLKLAYDGQGIRSEVAGDFYISEQDAAYNVSQKQVQDETEPTAGRPLTQLGPNVRALNSDHDEAETESQDLSRVLLSNLQHMKSDQIKHSSLSNHSTKLRRMENKSKQKLALAQNADMPKDFLQARDRLGSRHKISEISKSDIGTVSMQNIETTSLSMHDDQQTFQVLNEHLGEPKSKFLVHLRESHSRKTSEARPRRIQNFKLKNFRHKSSVQVRMINDNIPNARERLLPGDGHILAPKTSQYRSHASQQTRNQLAQAGRRSNQPQLPAASQIIRSIATACATLEKEEEQALLYWSRPLICSQVDAQASSASISLRGRKDFYRSAQNIEGIAGTYQDREQRIMGLDCLKSVSMNRSSREGAASSTDVSGLQTNYYASCQPMDIDLTPSASHVTHDERLQVRPQGRQWQAQDQRINYIHDEYVRLHNQVFDEYLNADSIVSKSGRYHLANEEQRHLRQMMASRQSSKLKKLYMSKSKSSAKAQYAKNIQIVTSQKQSTRGFDLWLRQNF